MHHVSSIYDMWAQEEAYQNGGGGGGALGLMELQKK